MPSRTTVELPLTASEWSMIQSAIRHYQHMETYRSLSRKIALLGLDKHAQCDAQSTMFCAQAGLCAERVI